MGEGHGSWNQAGGLARRWWQDARGRNALSRRWTHANVISSALADSHLCMQRPPTHLVRASPKSQILRSQVALSSRLEGLRSRCSTEAECRYLRPRSSCAARYSRHSRRFDQRQAVKSWVAFNGATEHPPARHKAMKGTI